jgi:hypothetical protein
MATPFASRAARLSTSINKAFGETFNIDPMVAQADVNDRFIPDTSRASILGVTGVWLAPATSGTPKARGFANDTSSNWVASFPSASFGDADLAWTPQPGDKLTRIFDGSIFKIDRSMPDGFGRTTLQLTARKR